MFSRLIRPATSARSTHSLHCATYYRCAARCCCVSYSKTLVVTIVWSNPHGSVCSHNFYTNVLFYAVL